MTNVFDPIIVKLTDETSGPTGGESGGGGIGGSIAGLTAGITGIASLMSEVVGLVKSAVDGVLKPVRTMLTGILKLIAQLLRPVVDVVMLMLMPILQFLKPIIRVANEIMRPFRTLAYGLMREAHESGNAVESNALNMLATQTILAGISNVLIGISGELIKMITGIALDILTVIPGVSQNFVNNIKGSINDSIDDATSFIQAQTLGGIMRLTQTIVGETDDEILRLSNMFERTISSANSNVANRIEEMNFYQELTNLASEIKTAQSNFSGDVNIVGDKFFQNMLSMSKKIDDGVDSILPDNFGNRISDKFKQLSDTINHNIDDMFSRINVNSNMVEKSGNRMPSWLLPVSPLAYGIGNIVKKLNNGGD